MATEQEILGYPSLSTSAQPYPILRALREEGVYKVHDRDEYLVSRHVDCVYALQHPEVFSSATPLNAEAQAGWEASVFSSDPPSHTEKRTIAFRSFNPGTIRNYEAMIQGVVDELIAGFIDDGRVEFVWQLANPLSSGVMFNLLGLEPAEIEWITSITFEGIAARYLPPDRQAEQDRDGQRVNEFMTAVVKERLDNLGDDVISNIIRGYLDRDGKVDPAYIAVESSVILIGGVLTPAHMMASAMKLLVEHPDQLAQVAADRSLIPRALEESLRLEAPDQFMPRYVNADTQLGGVDIPAGSLVLLLYASANRDDGVFPDPERFDIQRDNAKQHLSFGKGIHFCLGAPLARMIGRLAFETLLTRLTNIRLAPDARPVEPLESIFNRAPRALPLEFDRVA